MLLQHEELREKLRIVRTVLEQGGTFSGINRKVQLKPTKWSTPSNSSSSKPPTPAPDAAEQQQGAVAAEQPSQQSPAQPQQQPSQGSKAQPGESGVRSARTSSTGGGPPAAAAAADGKPQVTELLLILKYGGVLTHSGRAQAEELGKTFRMVMYPRCGQLALWLCAAAACWLQGRSSSLCSHLVGWGLRALLLLLKCVPATLKKHTHAYALHNHTALVLQVWSGWRWRLPAASLHVPPRPQDLFQR